MNIVFIASDETVISRFNNYATSLEYSFYHFSDIDNFHQWIVKNKKQSQSIDFVLISVCSQEPELFNHSASMINEYGIGKNAIIFILDLYRDSSIIKSLKYGIGYLHQETSCDLFFACINHHSKTSHLNKLLARKNRQLLEYQKHIEREYEMVEMLFSNHCKKHLKKSEFVNYYISPASLFNGDILLIEYGPSGSLYVAIGDVTGHGLPAAVGALPVFSSFRSMAKKGKSVGSIAYEMNKALIGLLPSHMMMAATILELNCHSGKTTIWMGGMPDGVILDSRGKIRHRVRSQHPPLAVLDNNKFHKDVQLFDLVEDERLYFFTDGIEESRNQQGVMFGEERLYKLFNSDVHSIFNRIIESHSQHIQGNSQDDDITLVEVVFSPLDKSENIHDNEPRTNTRESIPWNMTFVLEGEDLKRKDPVVQIINLIGGSIDIDPHQDYISTVLSEIFNNALEHGLLKIDSSIKDSEDGFFEYYNQRKERLEALTDGRIVIRCQYEANPENDFGELTIELSHNGAGFDSQEAIGAMEDNGSDYGRGIAMIKALSDHIEYSDFGRTVKAFHKIKRI